MIELIRSRTSLLALALAALLAPGGAVARQAPDSVVASTANISWKAIGVSAAAVAVALPRDGSVRTWAQDPARQGSSALRHVTDVLTPLGSTVPMATGAALFVFAHAFHHPTLADEVWHSGLAVGVASVSTQVLKVVVHRPRPRVAPHDAGAFFQGKLFSVDGDYASFPSGHTTLAFAVAGAAQEELEVHDFPHARLIGGGLHLLAAGVAFSRIYDDEHWLSDVVAGAAVGALTSRWVVRRAHRDGAETGRGARLLLVPGARTTLGVELPLGR